jgi:flagellar basal-body rod protein FlgF
LAFKEYLTAFEKGQTEDIDLPHKEWAPEDFYRSFGAENAMVKVDGSYTMYNQGQLTPSGNPLDLGLFGKGFFEVLTPTGIRYTRKGLFSLGADGALVNDQGFPVLSPLKIPETKEGEELPSLPEANQRKIIVGGSGSLNINLKGEIFRGSTKVGELSLVEFKDDQKLKKEGNSLFINNDVKNIKADQSTRVHQGFVEQSNVNAVEEMAALIKANRHFESIQKAMKAYDSMTGKAVNEISKF